MTFKYDLSYVHLFIISVMVMSKLKIPKTNIRKGTRSYDERKAMYDEGTDVVRPQMLVTVWNEKFAAWLQENPDQE